MVILCHSSIYVHVVLHLILQLCSSMKWMGFVYSPSLLYHPPCLHTFWHAIPVSYYIFIFVLYHTFIHITWHLPLSSAFPDCFSSKSEGLCCLLPRDESVFLLEWWCWCTGDRWRTGECDFLQNRKQHLKCHVNVYYVYTIWCLRKSKTQTLYRIQRTAVSRCNNNCKQ